MQVFHLGSTNLHPFVDRHVDIGLAFAEIAVARKDEKLQVRRHLCDEIGDVLLAWENEAFLAQREFGKDKFEIVAPPLSILAEPPISVVDKVAGKKGTRAAAEAYLKYWYTREGQEIAARNSYRPREQEIAKEYEKSFAKVELFTIDELFGGWTRAQKEHFAEGGIFDQIYKN